MHVVDSGKGIDESKISKLQKILIRGSSDGDEGISMGLELCSKIVEAYGG